MEVETNLSTPREMFAIAESHGMRARYCFRRCPLDATLARRIAAHEAEVGFHNEEIAANRLRLRNDAEVEALLPPGPGRICREYQVVCRATRLLAKNDPRTRDFSQPKLGIPNHYAIDGILRARFGIVVEPYDDWLDGPVQARFSEAEPPGRWSPGNPDETIRRRVPCICIPSAPVARNRMENARFKIERVMEGLLYQRRRAARELGSAGRGQGLESTRRGSDTCRH
jgi:hypothetical protein